MEKSQIYKKDEIVNRISDNWILFNYSEKTNTRNPEYVGEITPEKRYLAIGFDDFRLSDFTIVEPLFREYGARATFNRVAFDSSFPEIDIAKMNQILSGGNEIGDHTWFHCNYIFNYPMCNGQVPNECCNNSG